MKTRCTTITYILLILTLSSISLILTNDFKEEDGVIVLNYQNFEKAIYKKYDKILIEFYAPWCGHCNKIAPFYSKAAQTLRKDENPKYLAKVDVNEENRDIAAKYEIERFPTFIYFKNGDPEEFDGAKTEEGFIEWMRSKCALTTLSFSSPEAVMKFTEENTVAIVFFGNEPDLLPVYQEFAKVYDDLKFADCKSYECLSYFNVNNGDILIFKKFDGKNSLLKAIYTAEELKKFVDQNTISKVANFDELAAGLIFSKQIPGLFFYRVNGTEDDIRFNELANSLVDELKGEIQIVVTDIQEGVQKKLAEYAGIKSSHLPTILIHDTRESEIKNYKISNEINIKSITKEDILKFVNDWRNRKLNLYLKSEDIPASTAISTSSGPIVTIVGKTFKSIVYDNMFNDVLVQFYAPWDLESQKLIPIYEDLANKMKLANPSLIIAKIDATLNDVENHKIEYYPTIKLYKKFHKYNPIEFEHENTFNDLVVFLKLQIKELILPEVEDAEDVPVEKKEFITMEEFEQGDGEEGRKLYILMAGKVYDVTHFKHPGGNDVHVQKRLDDKIYQFSQVRGHSNMPANLLEKYLVGYLKDKKEDF